LDDSAEEQKKSGHHQQSKIPRLSKDASAPSGPLMEGCSGKKIDLAQR
jgi:hypothetical protein